MKKKRTRKRISKLLNLGFTNWLAVAIMLFIFTGLIMGFVLAVYSIRAQYNGALACFTVAFTPIGTACGIVLGKVVHKSQEENTDENGKGIKFAAAEAAGFRTNENWESPSI